jgi:phage-related tail protein
MEGNFLWEQWCKKKGLSKTYDEMRKIYSLGNIKLLDNVWDSQLQKYEQETVTNSKVIKYSESINVTFIVDLYKTAALSNVDVIVFSDERFEKHFIKVTYQNNEEIFVDISDVNIIDKPRIILGVINDNFNFIDGIIVYRRTN